MCSHFLANSDDLTTSVEWITGTDQGRLCSTRRPSLLRVPPAPQILSKKFGLKKKFKKNSSMNTPCIVWVMWSVVERIKGKWNTFAIRVSSGFSQHPKFSPRKLELKKIKKKTFTHQDPGDCLCLEISRGTDQGGLCSTFHPSQLWVPDPLLNPKIFSKSKNNSLQRQKWYEWNICLNDARLFTQRIAFLYLFFASMHWFIT